MPQAPAPLVPGEQATRTFRPASELSVGCADQFLNYRLLLIVRLSRKLSEFASNPDLVHESIPDVGPARVEDR